MAKKASNLKRYWKKTWHFIWEDNSIWSWLVNIVLAFVLIKFVVYPVLGLLLGTGFPIVAVVSSSMEHQWNYDGWWSVHSTYYENYGITKEMFQGYIFRNGFNKGDIIFLLGTDFEKIELGDVIVFDGGMSDPIIHRVIRIYNEGDERFMQTKGDNNAGTIPQLEQKIPKDKYIGRAIFRIPYLGYVKIWAVDLVNFLVNIIR